MSDFFKSLKINRTQVGLNRIDLLKVNAMIQRKTLNKRISTKSQGVFYKQVVDEKGKDIMNP